MDITYQYSISNLEYTNDDSKGVVTVHYNVKAMWGKEYVRSYGTVSFSPDPDASDFVTFDQLTEETVLNWVKAKLDTAQIEQALSQKLNKKLNPTIVSGLPWPTEDETQS